MVKVVANNNWRDEWFAANPKAERYRPQDKDLKTALDALQDESSTARDRKMAALRGVPTPVAAEERFSMWIPAPELTATFDEGTILSSLGTSDQPGLWKKCAEANNITDFRCIRGSGIRFSCNTKTICESLGNMELKICGQKFKVQPFSAFSHYYWVELRQLPEGTTDSDVYDWFENHGSPPLWIMPTYQVNGIMSRDRRVIFPQQQPPGCVLITENKPLRQIAFAHDFCVVNHRFATYNKVIPPFIAEQREERKKKFAAEKAAKKNKQKSSAKGTKTPEMSFEENNQDTSGQNNNDDSDDDDSDYVPGKEEENGDDSSEASESSDSSMGITFSAKPASIWSSSAVPPKFIGRTPKSLPSMFELVKRAKKLMLPTAAHPVTTVRALDHKNQEFLPVESLNIFQWLYNGDEQDPIPQDVDVELQDSEELPAKTVGYHVPLANETKTVMQAIFPTFKVNDMSLAQLCEFLDKFHKERNTNDDPELLLAHIHAQPSVFRPVYDSSTPANYTLFSDKVPRHAVLRASSYKNALPTSDERVRAVFGDVVDLRSPFELLTELCEKDNIHYWVNMYMAEVDLALQILAPSIYFDPFKVTTVIKAPARRIPLENWLLWDNRTIFELLKSDVGTKIFTDKLPEDLKNTLTELEKFLKENEPAL